MERYRSAEHIVSQMTSHPTGHAVEVYLANPFLNGLVPRKTAEQFYRVLSTFYVRFFGLNTHWTIRPPIMATSEFSIAALRLTYVISDMCKLIDMGFEGPLDIDESHKGYISESHIEFALQLQAYQNDLNDSLHDLFRYIDSRLTAHGNRVDTGS
jgi:hypothetical protein